MKINKKLIVSSLASAMGLSIVGAITGTVAWYQYSTRSTLAMIGVSAKTAANLQIKIADTANSYDSGYKTDLRVSDIQDYLDDTSVGKNNKLSPVTSGAQNKSAALAGLKAHPIYKVFAEADWGAADEEAYLVLPLKLKWDGVVEGEAVDDLSGKKIWLNNALFQEDSDNSGKGDLSKALRVHLHTTSKNYLISKDGANTNVFGILDLNRDGKPDDADFTWVDFDAVQAGDNYGTADATQTAWKAAKDPDNSSDTNFIAPVITNGVPAGDNYLGVTDDSGELEVTVTIWLEGWQTLEHIEREVVADGEPLTGYYTDAACTSAASGNGDGTTPYYHKVQKADWSEDLYLGAKFDLGLEFITERL